MALRFDWQRAWLKRWISQCLKTSTMANEGGSQPDSSCRRPRIYRRWCRTGIQKNSTRSHRSNNGKSSKVKVTFGFLAPLSSGIEVDFQEKEIIANPGEPFIVHFKIKYRGNREVSARIVHRVQPAAVGENLQMVQCGLLSPINLSPGSEQEMASVYFFDGNPSEVKQVLIAYEFKVEPPASNIAHVPLAVSPTKRM